jgi:ParB family chromosome partitioning protein
MANKSIQKIAMNAAENIPFDKLVLSQRNIRCMKDGLARDRAGDARWLPHYGRS